MTAASSVVAHGRWRMSCGLAQQACRSCGGRRRRSRSAPAGAGWWPCPRRAPRPGGRRTGRRPGVRGSAVVRRSLATCGWPPRRGRASRSSRPSTPKAAARSSSRCSRSVVARASSRARWVGWWSSRNRLARVPRRQFGHLVAHEAPGQRARVDDRVGQAGPAVRARGRRSGTTASKRTLWPTMTVPATNSTNDGSTLVDLRGAGTTIAWVMPVSTVISGGMAAPGFTRVWKVPRQLAAAHLARRRSR